MPHPRTRRAPVKDGGSKLFANFGITVFFAIVILTGANNYLGSSKGEVSNSSTWFAPLLAQADQSHDTPPIKVVAKIPQLDVVQHCMLEQVIVPILDDPDPLVHKPKVDIDPNTRQVFIELLFTESSFYHWEPRGDEQADCAFIKQPHAKWEIRNSGPKACGDDLCVGLGQLSGLPSVCDPELRYDPFENVYCALTYFVGKVKDYHGDYTLAVAAYKGAVKTSADGTTVLDPLNSDVVMVFDHDHLTLTK